MRNLFFIFLLAAISLSNLQGQNASHGVNERQTVESLRGLGLTVFHLINQKRVENSLPPLEWSSEIEKQALKHSLSMAKGETPFGHLDANLRFNALRRAIPSFKRYGENVAFNFGYSNPAEIAVEGWLKSEGHYANIMRDFNLTGVGVVLSPEGRYYFTQIFGKTNQ